MVINNFHWGYVYWVKIDFVEHGHLRSSGVAQPWSNIAGFAGVRLVGTVKQVAAHIAALPRSGVWSQLVGRGESSVSDHPPQRGAAHR